MNCIAIDDEPLALDIIQEFCRRICNLDLKGTYTNPLEAVELLNFSNIDLVFLDIHMPHISGLEFLKLLYNPPLIIFTTAFKEHAFHGFEFDAVDYLVKPFSYERFVKAVNKAFQITKLKNIGDSSINYNYRNSTDYMMIKIEYNTVRVELDDILYIEGLKDYVKIFTGSRTLITKTTMKNLDDKLPNNRFIRVHIYFIVSFDKI
jgi:DNA-binding LytR/AlgR family response regulator